MENPGRVNWEGVKRIFRYLAGTKDWALVSGTRGKGLEGVTDADGTSQEHHHTISRYAFLIDGTRSSKKEELVTFDGPYHARTKHIEHIDIHYHFIRFIVQTRSNNLIYCPTDDMAADTLTKALPASRRNISPLHSACNRLEGGV